MIFRWFSIHLWLLTSYPRFFGWSSRELWFLRFPAPFKTGVWKGCHNMGKWWLSHGFRSTLFSDTKKMEGQKLPNPKAEIGLKQMTAKNPQIPNRFELYWNAINLDFSHAETIQNQACGVCIYIYIHVCVISCWLTLLVLPTWSHSAHPRRSRPSWAWPPWEVSRPRTPAGAWWCLGELKVEVRPMIIDCWWYITVFDYMYVM